MFIVAGGVPGASCASGKDAVIRLSLTCQCATRVVASGRLRHLSPFECRQPGAQLGRGSLAQLVEQLTLNQRATGSSPVRPILQFAPRACPAAYGAARPTRVAWASGGMADTPDLGSGAARRRSSNLLSPTRNAGGMCPRWDRLGEDVGARASNTGCARKGRRQKAAPGTDMRE